MIGLADCVQRPPVLPNKSVRVRSVLKIVNGIVSVIFYFFGTERVMKMDPGTEKF